MGNIKLAGLLRSAGLAVHIHSDHFAPDAPDEEWLGFAGRQGLIVLTRDKAIRKRALEVDAFRRHRVRAVVLIGRGAAGLTNDENAKVILKALRVIRSDVANHAAPCIFRLRGDGTLQEQQLR